MLPSLLIVSTTIFSIVLCSSISYQQEEVQHHASSRGRSFARLGFLPIVSSTLLLKPRVGPLLYFMGSEWIVDHHDLTCMLPIGTAAATMQDFYEDLAAYAATTLTPASRDYHISFGQLMLEVLGPPMVVVNWIVVQHFALHMLRLTERGYTNTYQINFIHRPTGMMITFNLYTGLLRAVGS